MEPLREIPATIEELAAQAKDSDAERHAWRDKKPRQIYVPREQELVDAPAGLASTFRNSEGQTYVREELEKGTIRRYDLLRMPGKSRREKKRALREVRRALGV